MADQLAAMPEAADFNSIWGPRSRPADQRVGVPGGKQLKGNSQDLFRWSGSIWQFILSPTVFIHVSAHDLFIKGHRPHRSSPTPCILLLL